MSSRALRIAFIAAAVCFGAIAAYWYWSPFIAMNSMRSAAENRHADAFNQYVDYPKLRESLKGQFSAQVAKTLRDQGVGGTDMEKAGAALGAMVGLALVDGLIDAMVRPEAVMEFMTEAKLKAAEELGSQSPGRTGQEKVDWIFERKGVDRIVAYAFESGTQGSIQDERVGFVFDRSGFASWKLTEIHLPKGK